ncbi:VIR-like CYIR protein [Plasmodium cynomolgi strain B]|uniref:VIR-like CYIR protein n=1 Tax=Plasmodium cynomolgi (strain B) TaxID=1120755 RepID=K6UQG3_PLACD|nr:VIR-like CYIR protein [Plasmodium cynomolgi strain B]GAB65084.1 VIR-like CYIR protein [Plasmodium cynomolgi strain B]
MTLVGFEFLNLKSDDDKANKNSFIKTNICAFIELFFCFNFQEDIYKKLPSYKLYKKIDESITDTTYDNYCAKVNPLDITNDEITKFCQKFARNLKELPTIESIGKNAHDACLSVTYWFYYELNKILGKQGYSAHRERIINSFIDVESKIYNELLNANNKDKCPIEVKTNFEKKKEEKILYDYFNNYNTIFHCNNSSNKEKCSEYCKYVNEIYKKYIENQKKCCGINYLNCGDYFKCNGKYNPLILLNKLNCDIGEEGERLTEKQIRESQENYGNSDLIRSLRYNIFKCNMVKDDYGSSIGFCSVFPSSKYSFENVDNLHFSEEEDEKSRGVPINNGEEEVTTTHSELGSKSTLAAKDTKEAQCPEDKPVKLSSGACVEHNVRTTGVIGLKLIDKVPINRVRNMIKNNMKSNTTSLQVPNLLDDDSADINTLSGVYSMLQKSTFKMIILGVLGLGTIMMFFIYFKVIKNIIFNRNKFLY